MTTFKEYESFDGLGLANLVQNGVMSAQELLDAAIERVEQRNPKLNAVIHKMYDQAYATIRNKVPTGLFQGVPFLLKDLLADYAGTPLTMGSRFIQGYISAHDSELVARYKKAGLVIFGKTNVPELGLGTVTEPELFGPSRNPWDITRSPGGSSGGAAVAVAARMVPMAHGGDGAGSIRIPAAYCGLFGFKPTRGRTPVGSRFMRLWLGMVTEHVLTRSVRDSAAMLDVAAGLELGSPISLPKPQKSFLSSLDERMPKLRIAITEQTFLPGSQISKEYSQAFKNAAQLCQELGHTIEPVSLKIDHYDVIKALMIVMAAETAADLNLMAKYKGEKVNLREVEKLTAIVYRAGKCFTAADYAWAIHTLDMITKQQAEFFTQYDVLMTPTMLTPPPSVGEARLDRLESIALDVLLHTPKGPWLREFVLQGAKKNFSLIPYTPLFNITGQPAMSVPLAWDKNGLPIGTQFVGKFAEDAVLFRLAQQLETARPWAQRVPAMLASKHDIAAMPA